MNLKARARRQGVGYATARRWFGEGKLPVPARRADVLILAGGPAAPQPAGVTAVCARVSSAGQEAGLGRQVARAAGEGLAVGRVVTGAGSALKGKRRRFPALLCDECARPYGQRAADDRAARAAVATGGGGG